MCQTSSLPTELRTQPRLVCSFGFFEIGSYVTQAGLRLLVHLEDDLELPILPSTLLSSGIIGVCHHT